MELTLAATVILKGISGASLPLLGIWLYDKLGAGWASTALAGAILVVAPAAFWAIR